MRNVLGALAIDTRALLEARLLRLTLVLEEKAKVLGNSRELVELNLLVDLVDVLSVLRLHVCHRDTKCIERRQVGGGNEAGSLELLVLVGELLSCFLRVEDSRLDKLLSLD